MAICRWSHALLRIGTWMIALGSLLASRSIAVRSGASSLKLVDVMTDTGTPRVLPGMHWFDEVSSTMDAAKELISKGGLADDPIAAVVADHQLNGRGTKGRKWISGSKNVLMTVILHKKLIPIPLHLLPLRSGSLVAAALAPHITDNDANMKLKWPNDVLLDGKKLCGILIEMDGDHLLVGIGCNLATAPQVAETGPEGGRAAAALASRNHILRALLPSSAVDLSGEALDDLSAKEKEARLHEYCRAITVDIYGAFFDWIHSQEDDARSVLHDFSQHMDMSVQRLRDDHFSREGRSAGGTGAMEEAMAVVQPLGLNADGTLRVKHMHSGEEATLVAEYLR